MTFFAHKLGKFMKKKGYDTRRRRDNNKSNDYVRRCYKSKSKDHVVADCPYNVIMMRMRRRKRRKRR